MMTLKLPQWIWILVFVVIGVLLFSLIRGCNQSNLQLSKFNKADSLNRELLKTIANYKASTDSTNKQYQDSLAFMNGQYVLAKEQALRSDINLQEQININRSLIEKHKWAKYADTTAVTVPQEFVEECSGCFANLEKTTVLVDRYKTDINKLQDNWDKQSAIYQKRFKELDAEKIGFYNKINTLAKDQQKAIDELKPHGRLYLTWGVLWRGFPSAAGAGLMYQNKRNLIWGITCYYGQNGTTVETNIHFPLSLKFR
jgi:hypothetical protein